LYIARRAPVGKPEAVGRSPGRDRTAGADSEKEEGVSVIWQRGHGVR